VTSKESGDFISNDLDGLKQRFLDLGFIPEEMSCHILDEQEVTKPLLIHIMEELNSTISIHA
jgi:Fe2+ transport system protein FeoA